MTILGSFRIMPHDESIATGLAENTIEFLWYAGEENGLLGSTDIWRSYVKEGRDIVAMLNRDMMGYTTGYMSRNMKPRFDMITDHVDAPLTNRRYEVRLCLLRSCRRRKGSLSHHHRLRKRGRR